VPQIIVLTQLGRVERSLVEPKGYQTWSPVSMQTKHSRWGALIRGLKFLLVTEANSSGEHEALMLVFLEVSNEGICIFMTRTGNLEPGYDEEHHP
jgi:hypothetical protein